MYPIADDKALAIHKQLSNEGILWFTDLTQTDPYFVLPVIVGLINLINVQVFN
jgi:membrane protein insertase Oxa1/YidC/SpoIIIJ